MYCEAIYGNSFQKDNIYNRVDALVEEFKYLKHENLIVLHINGSNGKEELHYDHVMVVCGAIGSYRLVCNSIEDQKKLKLLNTIKHYPLLTSIFLTLKLPYPKQYITMSNFDVKVEIDGNLTYLNFFPLLGVLKAFNRKMMNFRFKSLTKILNNINTFLESLPDIPIFPYWWLQRLYVSNIYLTSNFSASYIGLNNNRVELYGSFCGDLEKIIFSKLLKKIFKKLRIIKIYNLLPYPFIHPPGSDVHFSSSLSWCVNEKGEINYTEGIESYDNLLVVDSSGSDYLLSSNSTYYFIARAIKLLRKYKRS